MSDNTDLGDEDGANNDSETTKKPNGLRSALDAANAAKAQLETEVAELRKESRKRTVAEALEKHGAKPSLAKFYDKTEASEDDVLGWLKENGEDFGWSEDNGDVDTDDEDTMREAQRISRATSSAPQRSVSPSLTREHLSNTDYKELRKQGLVL